MVNSTMTVQHNAQDAHDSKRPAESSADVGDDLRALFESSNDLICLANIDGYFKWLNERWTQVLGWPQEDMYARPFIDFVHPADIEATLDELKRLSEGLPSAIQFENRYKCADGSWRWLSWNSNPYPGGMLFCVARDVTHIHEERRELRTRVRQLELAETLSQVGNWRVGLEKIRFIGLLKYIVYMDYPLLSFLT